jgi:hypothetical protein
MAVSHDDLGLGKEWSGREEGRRREEKARRRDRLWHYVKSSRQFLTETK